MKEAYFAAGCFWGIEKKFSDMDGVVETAVGYMGGNVPGPTYEMVCSGETGHAETVKLVYDPQDVSYEELLEAFWHMHNPTCLNYQGWDVGTQYRSAIFYTDASQRELAQQSRAQLEATGPYNKPIVTEISEAATFWRAEEYHQRYLDKR